MGYPRKAIREGSAAEGVREVEGSERMNHDVTCNALYTKSNDRDMVSR